ncbi:MAG TPA: hypothetical protein VGN41_04820, partial [Streptosporangiaceae bacterium]
GWGGTSFVAPQLAGSAAVIDQYAGGRTGFWNPSVYALAGSPASPFSPLDASGAVNDNIYYTGTPGQTFNVGSGLGIPDLSRLAADLAATGADLAATGADLAATGGPARNATEGSAR